MAVEETGDVMFTIREAPATHVKSEVLLERSGTRVIRLDLPAGQQLPPHVAARDVALIVVSGSGRVTVNHSVLSVAAGAVVGLWPGELHGVYAETPLSFVVVQAPPTARSETPDITRWVFQGS